jgi:hypothetical protein
MSVAIVEPLLLLILLIGGVIHEGLSHSCEVFFADVIGHVAAGAVIRRQMLVESYYRGGLGITVS